MRNRGGGTFEDVTQGSGIVASLAYINVRELGRLGESEHLVPSHLVISRQNDRAGTLGLLVIEGEGAVGEAVPDQRGVH